MTGAKPSPGSSWGQQPGRALRVPHTPATVTQTRVPALHEMTPAAQVIALAWYEIGHREGYEAAERHHWRLPSYSEAVASCIALGTVGIDRAEHARRRREGS